MVLVVLLVTMSVVYQLNRAFSASEVTSSPTVEEQSRDAAAEKAYEKAAGETPEINDARELVEGTDDEEAGEFPEDDGSVQVKVLE